MSADADALLQAARAPLASGDHRAAAELLERAVALADDPRAWGLLGRCRRLLGEPEAAEHALQRALRLQPALHAARIELAAVYRMQQRITDARTLLEQVLTAEPSNFVARIEAASLFEDEAPAQAAAQLQAALQLRPQDAELAFRLGVIADRAGQPALAANAFVHAARLRPDWSSAWINAGSSLLQQGLREHALQMYRQAQQLEPQRVDVLLGLANAQADDGAGRAARLQLLRQLCATTPSPLHWALLASALFTAGDIAACHRALDAARVLDPGYLPAQWAAFQWPRTPAPQDAADMHATIARWQAGVTAFAALPTTAADAMAAADECIPLATAFFRHYLPGADADQPRYGAMLRRITVARHGDAPLRAMRARRRIAMASAHLHWHTVSRLFVPLIDRLDTSRFDVDLLCLGALDPAWTPRLQAAGVRIHAPRPLAQWRQWLRDAAPDVLLFLDIGMEPLSQALAAQRHAPVQATLWGHPITTGLDSIDYYLGPDAIECHDAASHYTERLVRLPGFGHGFEPDAMHDGHDACALPADAALRLLCTQSVYKLLPEQDDAFARILAALPDATLHLLPHQDAGVRAWLLERMRPALQRHGVEVQRIVMHPHAGFDGYLQLAARCTMNLDSFGFSGGMSSFDLLSIGLPTATLPGATMRSRQTAAMLQALGAAELIAHDIDDYVRIAVELARDRPRRDAIAVRLRSARMRICGRDAAASALSEWLATVQPR